MTDTNNFFISKSLTVLLVFLNIFFTFSGCSNKNKVRSTSEITVALGSAPATLDPVISTDATGMRMVSLIYQGLVKIGPDLNPSPDLAHRWVINNENYLFFIKSNIKFSDGNPVDCDSILESIKKYQDSKSPFNSVFKVVNTQNCIIKGDDIELSLKLDKPSVKFMLADLPVLKIKGKENKGSGPFVIKSNTPASTVLSPNKFYKDLQTYDLEFKYLKDDFSRFLKVYKGEIDVAPNSIPFEKVESFKGSKFNIIETASLSTSYLLINHKNKALSNLDFRKDLYKSIGIKDLVVNRFENHVTKAHTLLSPSHPYFPEDTKNIEFKLSGNEYKKPLITLKSSNSRQARETGKIISQKLRSKGIPTRLHSYEWGTFYKDIKAGNFDIALMKWVGVVDPDLYNLAFHSEEFPPGRNRGYYRNLNLDKALDAAKGVTSLDDRINAYKGVQKAVFKDLAIIPLWHENQIHIVHERLKNYKVNPMGDFFSLLDLEVAN